MGLCNTVSQIYPPKPKFTENELPNLAGKVYIVTGSNTGVGKELAQILYSKNAKVYVAARSEEKAPAAINSIQQQHPNSKGRLIFLHLDLADLTTIKSSAEKFLAQETKLDVLFNNAGVMFPPLGSKTAQGYELQMGVNNLGHFLFTKLLTPILRETTKREPANSVRVIWVSSMGAELYSANNGGIPLGDLDGYTEKGFNNEFMYGVSKAGNYLHATEYARRFGKEGIVSVALHPGTLSSDLGRNMSRMRHKILEMTILYPPVNGAYTELFAGLSSEVTIESIKKSDWIIPFGRFGPLRGDLIAASKPESEGGSGVGQKWWKWSEDQVRQFE